jgi:hypothetical protein
MNLMPLNLPEGSTTVNYLHKEMTVEDLTQDLVTVQLPTGYFIDVGWYPEHDSNGDFWVRVYYGSWDQQMRDPIKVKHLFQVKQFVEKLAQLYSAPIVLASSCGSSEAAGRVEKEKAELLSTPAA